MTEEPAIRVDLIEGLTGTPALELAIRGWAECVENHFGDGTLGVHGEQHAMLAYAPNGRDMLPVGVMTFTHYPTTKLVWIQQSYVVPEFRGRGIYTTMWRKMVEHAVSLKVLSIQSGTHTRNATMRAIAKKQGRFEEFVITRFNLT